MTAPEVHVQPTAYTVSCIPEGHEARPALEITVAYRGRGLWAVLNGRGGCLSKSGRWDWEPRPSERTEHWLADHRFALDTALDLAKRFAPHLTVNGHTVADVLADIDKENR